MWTERRSNLNQKRNAKDHRLPFERDNTRVIHSAAFRRLQRKTQILSTNEGDFHRTRLTHSLEVASIAKSIVRNLNQRNDALSLLPCDDLMTTISLLHDIGHPPFGHGGEVALNYMMRAHGGFESNGQTLRLISKIENTYGPFGLDLTRRTLLGILKYPIAYQRACRKRWPKNIKTPLRINDWLPPKSYLDSEESVVQWILSPLPENDALNFQSLTEPDDHHHGHSLFKSLDCSIMNIADDIAYGVHDFEDAVHLKLIHRDIFETDEFKRCLDEASQCLDLPSKTTLLNKLFSYDKQERKNAIGGLVNFFITNVDLTSSDDKCEFITPLLAQKAILPTPAHNLLRYFKNTVFAFVIDSPDARAIEYGGQTVVLKLFEAIQSNPLALLSLEAREKYQRATNAFEAQREICDFIANMTDEYAYRCYKRLYGFSTQSIFERAFS